MKRLELSRITGFLSRRSGGIRRRLLIWGLTLLGIALITNTLAGSFYTRRLIVRETAELQTEIASRVALEIEDFIRRKVERLRDVADSASLYELGGKEQRLLLLLVLKNDRAFTEGSILDGNGKEALKISERKVYLPEELMDQSASEKYKNAIKGGSYISPVYTSDKAEPYITISVPLKITPQEILGVVSVEANLKFLWDVIGEIEFSRAGYAYLVDSRGNLIAYRDPSLVLKRTNLSGLHSMQDFLRNPSAPDPSPAGEDDGITGKRVLSTFATVGDLGWAVVLEEPVDAALAEVRKVESYAVLLLGMGMLVGALIIVLVSNRITRPILELHHGAEVIGRGNLRHRVEIQTGDEIEQLAQEFNKMAGELQVSYSTLEHRVEQRTSELAALNDVTATVNQFLELDTVLQEVIRKVSEIFRFDATRIFLLDSQGNELHLRASFETAPEFFAQARVFKRGQGIVGSVVESGLPTIFEDALTDPRYLARSHTKVTQKAGFSFFAVFPIKAKGKPVGTIVFVGKKPRKLTPEEVRLLNSMADQIGVAVENTTLFEETVARARELAALYDVAATLNQSLDLDLVLKEAIRKILEATQFDAARIHLVSPDGKKLQLRAYEGISPEWASRMATYSATSGIEGEAVTKGKAVIFEDVQADPRYAAVARTRTAQEAGFRAFLTIPLKAKEKVIGTMSFFSYKAHNFSAKDLALFTSMASQIGVAMENAALFEETVTRAKEISALYDITAAVNQSLEPDVALREVLQKILEVTHFDAARVYLLDSHGKELWLKAYEGLSPEFASQTRMDLVEVGVNGHVVATRKPAIFADIQTDPQYAEIASGRMAQKAGFRGYIGLPLESKTKILGVINFLSYQLHEFSARDLALFTSMANQIGVALENSALFEQAKTRSRQLAALNAISATVNRSLELEVVLKESVDKVCELLGFDAGWIYVLAPSGEELHLRASKGLSDEFVRTIYRRDVGKGSMGRVIENGEPLVYEDIQADPRYAQISAGRRSQAWGFRTLCNFPVKSKGKIVGVLNLANYSPRRFPPEELELIGSIANEIGVGMENARLFEETVNGANQLSALYTVTATVNQSLDLEHVLQEVIEKITGIFSFDTTRIYLLDPRADELHVRASYPVNREDMNRVRMFRRGEGIVGKVAETGEPIIFGDLQNDPRYKELSSTKNTQKTGHGFLAVFPIPAQLKTVGAIVCNGRTPRRLAPGEIQLITSMAGQIGVAIENANLFYETRQKSSELEKTNIELVEANRAKADFLAAMSHELRTPLNVIIGNADLVKDGTFGDVTEKQKGSLDKILHYSETLLKLINDVLTLTKVEARKVSLNLTTFRVDEIITHAQSYVEQLNRNGRLKVLWEVEPDLPPVTTDALKVEEILQNLIGNAFKFTSQGSIEVRVRNLKRKKRMEFSVADTGIGIAGDDLDKIWEQFHQLKEAHTGSYSGVGLGLSIVKRYLEMMEGQIKVESEPGKGTTFTFDLPYSIRKDEARKEAEVEHEWRP